MKSQYLNTEQVEELEGQEYIHNADELASLYMTQVSDLEFKPFEHTL